jgi:hypothetical protein
MDLKTFTEELDAIEACFPLYRAWTEDDKAKQKSFRNSLWDTIKKFPKESLRDVRLQISRGELGERMPTAPEIHEACKQFADAQRKSKGNVEGTRYLMNYNVCYTGSIPETMKVDEAEKKHGKVIAVHTFHLVCGCPKCKPKIWCRFDGCQSPVENMMQTLRTHSLRSTEYCPSHRDGQPETPPLP